MIEARVISTARHDELELLLACDAEAGLLTVDALDCLDGTPVVDVKPWIASVDLPPEADT